METARIHFKNLKGFAVYSEEQKIETEDFLRASNEIVDIIQTFGTLFTPVINDMNGNITKIRKTYQKDNVKYKFLEDFIELTISTEDRCTLDALLWLKRGLQLIYRFFENIYNDKEKTSVVKQHLKDAYDCTLRQHHGLIVQSTVKIIYCWLPNRNQLLGENVEHEENMQALTSYLPDMKTHLDRIDNILISHKLEKH